MTDTPRPGGPLAGLVAASVEGFVEAIYPPSDGPAPDFREAEMAPRTLAFITALPPTQRRLVMLMFVALNVFAPVLAPLGGPMSWRSPERRLAAVQGWKHSRFYWFRKLADALHAFLQMVYLSHPAVVRLTGEYTWADNPDDAFRVDVRPHPEAP